jgi:hypothetical protein
MSSSLRVSIRSRWAAREMILAKWHKGPGDTFKYGEPIADLLVDGDHETVIYEARHGSDPEGGIYWLYPVEGGEVGPWGQLLEYTDWAYGSPGPKAGKVRSPSPIKYVRRAKYPKIFISYRRKDTDVYAGRLHEALTREFGQEDVFFNLFSIRPGEQFPWTLQQSVWHAQVMIALIGPDWSGQFQVQGETFKRRAIDSEFDYVRREVLAALDTGTIVIPVLVSGADFPHSLALGVEFMSLSDTQALELGARHWESDVKTLVETIRESLKE